MSADGDFIVNDTVKLIQQEAPRGLALILLFLFGVLLFVIRPVSRAVIIMGHLAVGLVLLSGLLWLIGVPLNILNISAISIVLGARGAKPVFGGARSGSPTPYKSCDLRRLLFRLTSIEMAQRAPFGSSKVRTNRVP